MEFRDCAEGSQPCPLYADSAMAQTSCTHLALLDNTGQPHCFIFHSKLSLVLTEKNQFELTYKNDCETYTNYFYISDLLSLSYGDQVRGGKATQNIILQRSDDP